MHLFILMGVKVCLDVLGTGTVGSGPPVVAGSDGTANHHSVFHLLTFFVAKVIWQLPKSKYANYSIFGALRVYVQVIVASIIVEEPYESGWTSDMVMTGYGLSPTPMRYLLDSRSVTR